MIDTHCHLIDPQFTKDLSDVLERAQTLGIRKIINAGYDVNTSKEAIAMRRKIDWLLPAIGIHPNEAAAESIKKMKEIEKLVKNDNISAIGETGLDYYRDRSPKEAQQALFRMHIDIAKQNDLPLLIHTRNSIDDAIKILEEEKYYLGVFHCYSGSINQAQTILDMGFYLGFGGVLTYSKRIRDVLRKIPLNRILLETDAPFLSPEGYRGQRNEPSFIIETLSAAANVLEIPTKKLESILDANAAKLFSL
jgi:TatD DNase family protein